MSDEIGTPQEIWLVLCEDGLPCPYTYGTEAAATQAARAQDGRCLACHDSYRHRIRLYRAVKS